MVHLDLFSGIGGFALACQWAGIETILFVEIDKYCQEVLRKHWPNVPIVEDIRDVEKIKQIIENTIGSNGRGKNRNLADKRRIASEAGRKGIPENAERQTGIAIADNQPTDSNGQAEANRTQSPAILVTAGFPCQPFSVAGKRQGEKDDRYLWPETLAVIEAIKPQWVLLENVTGIKSVYQSDMLSELEGREYLTEEEATANLNGILEREATNTLWLVLEGLRGAGYEVEVLVIPACAVNAWHRRDRIWIIAWNTESNRGYQERGFQEGQTTITRGICADVPHSTSRESREQTEQEGGQGSGRGSQEVSIAKPRLLRQEKCQQPATGIEQCDWRAVEPELGGLVNGLPYWVDGYFDIEPDIPRVAKGIKNRNERVKCLGNAIVPQVAYEIIRVIKDLA